MSKPKKKKQTAIDKEKISAILEVIDSIQEQVDSLREQVNDLLPRRKQTSMIGGEDRISAISSCLNDNYFTSCVTSSV